jgi:GGDEF domain-containing protein
MTERKNPRSVMFQEPGLQRRTGSVLFAAEPEASGAPRPETPRSPAAPISTHHRVWAGEKLLGMGGSLRLLAITVIVVLSAGMALLLYGQLRQNSAVTNMIGDPAGLLGGFGFLMLLTVIYLVSKHWATRRNQRDMIEQILEEEAVARALRQNPITDFHHPEVCRDILMQQASHAARLHAPLSLLEVQIEKLGQLSVNPATQPRVAELIRQIKGLCRATDSVLRWTPDSFLLAFPEVTREELAPISERLRQELEQWIEQHFEPAVRPALRWRGASSTSLDSCGDILLETQRLLERESRLASAKPEGNKTPAKREKAIALAVELEITGEDRYKKFFEETVVTERVAADRFWCQLKPELNEMSPLSVAAPDGSFCEQAVLVRRGEDRLAEIQFAKAPDRWVIRSGA